MFKTALTSLLIFFSVISISRSEQSYFMMNTQVFCDETKSITDFIQQRNMMSIVKGLVTMVNNRTIAVTIYANDEEVLIIGHDPEGFSCFLGDIDTIIEWDIEIDLPKNVPYNSKNPS